MTDANPFERRMGRIGKSGRKAEKRTVKRLGAKEQLASGATAGLKGDMALEHALIENKSTVNASFSVKHAHLAKIAREAAADGKAPALAFQFTHPNGIPLPYGAWVMLPEWLYMELLQGGST